MHLLVPEVLWIVSVTKVLLYPVYLILQEIVVKPIVIATHQDADLCGFGLVMDFALD